MMPSMSYSTGSSVVISLSLMSFSSVSAEYKRRRLAGAGRSGHQHDAVGAIDRLAEMRPSSLRPCRRSRDSG